MFIGFDPASNDGDYSGEVWYKVDNGKINIKKVITKKEVKKVKKSVNYKKLPYFETKVVRVEKEVCHHENVVCKNGTIKCKDCGRYLKINYRPPDKDGCGIWGFAINEYMQPKGNWVNGENLDKIKFPCFCSYIHAVTKKKHYAKIDKGWDDIAYKEKYIMSKISNEITSCIVATTEPVPELSILYEDISLTKLIKNLDIHILKGKIIIWEEANE